VQRGARRGARAARGARRRATRRGARRAARGTNANAFARRAARPAAPHWILQRLFSALQLEFGLLTGFLGFGLDFCLLFQGCTGIFRALDWIFGCFATIFLIAALEFSVHCTGISIALH